MTRNGLSWADLPLRDYSLTHLLTYQGKSRPKEHNKKKINKAEANSFYMLLLYYNDG